MATPVNWVDVSNSISTVIIVDLFVTNYWWPVICVLYFKSFCLFSLLIKSLPVQVRIGQLLMLFLNRGTAMQGGRTFIEWSLDLKILMIIKVRDTFWHYQFVFLCELHRLCCSDLELVYVVSWPCGMGWVKLPCGSLIAHHGITTPCSANKLTKKMRNPCKLRVEQFWAQ